MALALGRREGKGERGALRRRGMGRDARGQERRTLASYCDGASQMVWMKMLYGRVIAEW